MAITEQQALQIARIITTPEMASAQTSEQLKELVGILRTYQDERNLLRQQTAGATPSQQDRVDAALSERTAQPGLQAGEGAIKRSGTAAVVDGMIQFVEGAGDFATDVGVALGIGDDETRIAYKSVVKQNRMERLVKHIEQFGELPPVGAQILGQVAPFLLGKDPRGLAYLMSAARQTLFGTFAATQQFQENGSLADRAIHAAIGGSLGAGGALLFGAKEGARAAAARVFTRRLTGNDSQAAQRILARTQDMLKREDFGFSVAQITGNRTAAGIELTAADQITKQAQRSNLNLLGRNLLRMSRTLSKNNKSPGFIANSLRNTLKDAQTKIYKEATDEFSRNVESIVTHFGDDVAVDGIAYLQKLDDLILETTDVLVTLGAKPSRNLSRYRDAVEELVNPMVVRLEGTKVFVLERATQVRVPFQGSEAEALIQVAKINAEFGGLTSDQSFKLLKGLVKAIGGDNPLLKRATLHSNQQIGRALMGNFVSAMEGTEATAAAKAVQSVRSMYKTSVERATAIENMLVASVFGGKMKQGAEEALEQVLNQSKGDLVRTREFLEEWNPQLLDDLRATDIRNIVVNSRNDAAAAVDSSIDLVKLANNLGGKGGAGQRGRGLHTAATQADLKLTADALRVLNNKFFKGIIPGGIRAEEVAINVISRSPEFMARFVTRVLASGSTVERLMIDPAARKAIQKIAEAGVDTSVTRAAFVYLTLLLNNEDEIREQAKQQATVQASQATTNRLSQ